MRQGRTSTAHSQQRVDHGKRELKGSHSVARLHRVEPPEQANLRSPSQTNLDCRLDVDRVGVDPHFGERPHEPGLSLGTEAEQVFEFVGQPRDCFVEARRAGTEGRTVAASTHRVAPESSSPVRAVDRDLQVRQRLWRNYPGAPLAGRGPTPTDKRVPGPRPRNGCGLQEPPRGASPFSDQRARAGFRQWGLLGGTPWLHSCAFASRSLPDVEAFAAATTQSVSLRPLKGPAFADGEMADGTRS